MSNPTNAQTVSDIYFQAGIAKATLKANLREVAREYSDRCKRLEQVQQEAQRQAAIHGNSALLNGLGEMSLSPDLQKLLVNPLHGL